MIDQLRTGDHVQVTTGPDRGWEGEITQIHPRGEPLRIVVSFGHTREDSWFASYEPHQLKVVAFGW